MRKSLFVCLLVVLGVTCAFSSVCAIDVGWMQKGVRVWYLGAAGSGTSSDAEVDLADAILASKILAGFGLPQELGPEADVNGGVVIGGQELI